MAPRGKKDNFKSTAWTSPKGPIIFVHLDAPNKPYEEGGVPKYEVALVVDEAMEKAIVAKFKAVWVEAGLDVKKFNEPIKEYTNKQEETVRFLPAKSAKKPAVFDAKKQSIPPSIVPGAGSVVKLDLGLKPYTGMGGGVTAYLNGVQVITLQQSGGRGAAAFEEEEGGYVAAAERDTSEPAGDDGEDMHDF